MKLFRKIGIGLSVLILGLYIALCGYLYFNQNDILFPGTKIEVDKQFQYGDNAYEMTIKTKDGINLNGMLFTADSSKGLVYYLHGNGGIIQTIAYVANNFTKLNYDVFILDYRGFGKSEGTIESEEQFFSDAQTVYDALKKDYDEEHITILGYSIGTCVATYLASTNNPERLVLQAPYYNMGELANSKYPIVPTFLLKYPFKTNEYISKVKAPIVLLHGNADELIDYNCSVKLKALTKPGDKLIKLDGLGHGGWTGTKQYEDALNQIFRP